MDQRDEAADVLRAWALDEDLKRVVMSTPQLAAVASRIARQYSAGETIAEALASAERSKLRGHRASIEYTGESVRDRDLAEKELTVFLDLAAALRGSNLESTVSFDLSHIGSVIDHDLGLENARRLARATEPLGTSLMISAETSDRTDGVLDIHEALAADYPHVGITIQARLHRSADDLALVLDRPGNIRLVKGAFLESADIAHSRGSSELRSAYLQLADRLIESGHPVSIATHDDDLVREIIRRHPNPGSHVEFEMLLGLGTELLDQLHASGFATREYSIFGGEWWLYVLNRIAEQPERVFDAILAAGSPGLTAKRRTIT